MHKRIAQLHQHHAERLDEVLRACTQPLSAHDIVPIMFKREPDAHQLTFAALGEALAHCHYLWFEGKLKRELGADERFIVLWHASCLSQASHMNIPKLLRFQTFGAEDGSLRDVYFQRHRN